MNNLHNKEGPDHDVGSHDYRLTRDGTKMITRDGTKRMARDETERMARDGTERMARDGTERMARDGTERLARDGTEKMTRDGTERLARDGTEKMTRDGTERMARDGTRGRPTWISFHYLKCKRIQLKYPIYKPPGKGLFNREKYFRRRNEIGGKPPFGSGEAELCPDVNRGVISDFEMQISEFGA